MDVLIALLIAAATVAWLCWQIPRDMKRERERREKMTPEERRDQFSWDAW